MKKLLFTFFLMVGLTGCYTFERRSGSSVTVPTTNTPSDIHVVATNTVAVADPITVKLDEKTKEAFIEAIKAIEQRTNTSVFVLQTNLNSVNIYPVITNTVNIPNVLTITLDSGAVTNVIFKILDKVKGGAGGLGNIILGALAGFIFAFLASWLSERGLARRTLLAVKAEEKNIFLIYKQNLGKQVELLWPGISGERPANNNIFNTKAALTVDWFPIFHGCAANIGLLNENDAAIVLETYAAMKSLIESYHLNNTLLDEANTLGMDVSPDHQPKNISNAKQQAHLAKLKEWAMDIIKSHDDYLLARIKLENIKPNRFHMYWH